jgi:large subunit ribosomal protein L11
MANTKPVRANLKMKIRGGQASAAPPVGSTLGRMGQNLTVHITIYEDRKMDWRVVGTPTDELILKAIGTDKGSGEPNKTKVTKKLSQAQLTEIAETKAADMNAEDVEAIKKMVAGTARSMGVEVE